MTLRLLIAAAALWVMGSAAALAHHSFAMFDMTKEVTIEGTIKTFRWVNPHAWIEIDVPQADGTTKMWAVEMTSPNNLARQGWKRSTLKVGDKSYKQVLKVERVSGGDTGFSPFGDEEHDR